MCTCIIRNSSNLQISQDFQYLLSKYYIVQNWTGDQYQIKLSRESTTISKGKRSGAIKTFFQSRCLRSQLCRQGRRATLTWKKGKFCEGDLNISTWKRESQGISRKEAPLKPEGETSWVGTRVAARVHQLKEGGRCICVGKDFNSNLDATSSPAAYSAWQMLHTSSSSTSSTRRRCISFNLLRALQPFQAPSSLLHTIWSRVRPASVPQMYKKAVV